MVARGIKVILGQTIASIEKNRSLVAGHARERREASRAIKVMFAIGRVPNTKNIGLEERRRGH